MQCIPFYLLEPPSKAMLRSPTEIYSKTRQVVICRNDVLAKSFKTCNWCMNRWYCCWMSKCKMSFHDSFSNCSFFSMLLRILYKELTITKNQTNQYHEDVCVLELTNRVKVLSAMLFSIAFKYAVRSARMQATMLHNDGPRKFFWHMPTTWTIKATQLSK